MKATATTAAVLSVLLAGGALGAEKLPLVERALTDKTIDLGEKGDSAGDLLVFANPVFDQANRVQVGTDQGYCVRTVAGKAYECFWTLSLKDGQITSEGPFLDAGDSVMAVTGGTGKYVGVTGSLKLHARDAKGTAFDFVYELNVAGVKPL